MPVHAIRVETSKIATGPPIETVVSNVLADMSIVLPDRETPLTVHNPTETEALNEPYRAGLWRFDPDDHPADELLDAFETALSNTAKWYRIRYYLCDYDTTPHDSDTHSWNDEKTRTGGPVPPELA